MMEDIDRQIKELQGKLTSAMKDYQDRFITPVLEHRQAPVRDIFQMALAQDTIHLHEAQYELLLAQKFPDGYTPEAIVHFTEEVAKYEKRIKAWQNRQFPSKFKETTS